MAIANYFYNQTTRKYVALFGTLFNQLKIKREDNAGVTKKEMIVPLSYAPYQKILARVAADPDLINSRRPAMTLPRMSFEMTSMQYDPLRKLASTQKVIKRQKAEADNSRNFVYTPVPYTLDFSLYIMTKYAEDATKLMEQILPFFTPDFTVGAKMIPDLDPIDIPIVLTSVTTEDLYEGAFEERQAILYTLTFTMKGWFFGPEKTKKVIKFVDIDMFNGTDENSPFLEGIDIKPGMSANGEPITEVGVTATATSLLTNGVVSSIKLINDGENYNANTVVTIGAPDTANAVITSNITLGRVTDITIDNGGGYFSSAPTASIGLPDQPITTATAIATVSSGSLANVSITNSGNFYNSPTFSIAPPPNVAAEFKFGDDALAHASENDVTLLHTFTGYFSSNTGYKVSFWIYPTSFPTGNPLSVLFSPFTKVFYDASTGQVRYQHGGSPVVNSDTNLVLNQWNHVEVEHYTNLIRINVNGLYGTQEERGAGNVAFPAHTYRAGDAQGNESVFDGANRSFLGYLDNVTWETTGDMPTAASGDPYTIPTTARTGDIITKNFDKDLPAATLEVTNGEVTGITVTATGSGYGNTAPIITIAEPDSTPSAFAASISPVLTNGIISAITINNAGRFYANSPAINVSAPTSTQATAIANVGNNGDVQSITITNAGLGYRTAPNVTISTPDFGSIPYGDIEFDDNWGIIKTIVSE
jgi:hypothetical protein